MNIKKKIGVFLQKIGIKQQVVRFDLKVNGIYRNLIIYLRSKFIPRLVKIRSQKKILAIDINNNNGIGSKLSWCVVLFKYCEENSLMPYIRFSYPNNKQDYFATFFSLNAPNIPKMKMVFTSIRFLYEAGLPKSYGNNISILEANKLINKYLRINQTVQNETDLFFEQHFKGKKVIGVHYRGTDKKGEAPYVSYQKVIKNIEYTLSNLLNADAVFISTDDQYFVDYIQLNLKNITLIIRKDFKRSTNNLAIHLDESLNKDNVNKDAIINSLLLSKCDFLIKTSSFLSDFSKLMNPSLPTVILNKPYESTLWFPTKQILQNMAFQPIL